MAQPATASTGGLEPSRMDVTMIARVAHDADRALLAARGDLSLPSWFALDTWERESLVRGVKVAINTPGAEAETLHAAWLLDMKSRGWATGPEPSRTLKQHPFIQPWTQLTALQRLRDGLFLGITRALCPEGTF